MSLTAAPEGPARARLRRIVRDGDRSALLALAGDAHPDSVDAVLAQGADPDRAARVLLTVADRIDASRREAARARARTMTGAPGLLLRIELGPVPADLPDFERAARSPVPALRSAGLRGLIEYYRKAGRHAVAETYVREFQREGER